MVYNTRSRRLFQWINNIFMVIFSAIIILPFLNLLAISFSDYYSNMSRNIVFWPKGFNVRAYTKILTDSVFQTSFINTVWLTVVTTALTILIAVCAGFALASKHLKHPKLILFFFLVPMYFSGGLIPTYLVIQKYLHLGNTYWALILPLITNSFYIIIFRNNIMGLPHELIESSEVDGANEYTTLFRIVMPIILPTIAAFIIINAVVHWNEWYNVMLYIKDNSKWTLQFYLRNLLMAEATVEKLSASAGVIDYATAIHPESFKMAALFVTIIPILAVYPFCQRYFIYGVITGAVKG